MTLLFDQNLPASLIATFAAEFPGSQHVRLVGLDRTPDDQIWSFAQANGLSIVTKDGDFHQMARLRGSPPKVIWLRLGNCPLQDLVAALRSNVADIKEFLGKDDGSILTIE